MDFDHLQEQIKQRFWRCNELTEKQADDYAWIAVQQIKRHLIDASGVDTVFTTGIATIMQSEAV